MRIELSSAEKIRLDTLIGERDDNFRILELYSRYLNECPQAIRSQMINELTSDGAISVEDAFSALLAYIFDLDTDREKDRLLIRRYLQPNVELLDPNKYKKDPYYKNIVFPEKTLGEWSFCLQKYEPYEGFVCRDISLDASMREYVHIGFFDEEFQFPSVFQKGIEWMAIKPNEIETMREPIAAAHGRVVTLGLGLGYFAYMASEKPNVDEVTIVERDKSVIELFKEHLLPQFTNRKKITVVCADAFDWLDNSMRKDRYDFLFADLWHDTSDGLPLYMKIKKREARFSSTVFSYWIERSILSRLRWCIFDKILEEAYENSKYPVFQDNVLRSCEDIKRYLSDDSLRLIVKDLK